MPYSPRNIKLACNHRGLTHFGGIHLLHQFLRVLHFRDFLAQQIRYSRRNRDYSVSQMLLALIYPIVLGLDRIETASLLRSNGTFQYLTGLPSFPDPQTLRRFLLNAPAHLREQVHRANDRVLERFIHLPDHRSRLILDLDSTVVTVFGHQEGAAVGYNPRYRGKRSYDPLLCLEANSSFLWDVELRRGDAGTWAGSEELLACCFHSTRVEPTSETLSPAFTPDAIRPQAASSAAPANSAQVSGFQAPPALRSAAVRCGSRPTRSRNRPATEPAVARSSFRLCIERIVCCAVAMAMTLEAQRAWNWAGRVCKKACVPSFLSSVPAQSPKSEASSDWPSAWLVSSPRLTASSEYFTANGAFERICFRIASARLIRSATGTTSFASPIR